MYQRIYVCVGQQSKVDSKPPTFWKWTSGVHKDKKAIGRECPAYKQDGECGSCRACWRRSIKQVSYKEHQYE